MEKGFTHRHFYNLRFNFLKLFSSKEKSDRGFTLVEILVVIFIIGLLSSIVIANFPEGKRQFALQRSAHKLMQDLRVVQEIALPAEEKVCDGERKANGFGAYFDQSSSESYLLFANCDTSYDYNSTADRELKVMNFEKGVKIFSLSPGFTLSVIFVPPSPTVYINGNGGVSEAQIVISLKDDTSETKTIKINKAGLIEIE